MSDLEAQEPAQITIPAIAADGSLFPMEKMEAHRTGQLHLAISVFVLSPNGDLLIQQRALHKYHCGAQWANTCCSHPHWGEDVATAANRRLQEELGFELPLEAKGVIKYRADVGNGLIEHERVHMFRGFAEPQSLRLQLNEEEVAQVKWISLAALQSQMAREPEHFTPWFRIYVSNFMSLWAQAA
ncbi:MAG: isopentenyl-diphosphate Delta-isomerase [Pseudomonadota bacterium]